MNSAEGSRRLTASASSSLTLEDDVDDAEDSDDVVRWSAEDEMCGYCDEDEGRGEFSICLCFRRSRRGFRSFDLTLVETADRCSCRGKVRCARDKI